jgi:DNA repair exonuclease SbcCD ATPase subunit
MKITLQNFRCFKEKVIEIPQGNISLLKGESGKGKTTILEAFRYGIFSGLRNIYPLNFKPSSTNQTIVSIEFPGHKLRKIVRSSPPEQLKVYIKKDNVSEEDGFESFDILESEAAQRYIETIFSSKDIWIASSYIAQGERSPLMTYSNAEKTNLLCSILFGDKFNSDINTFDNPDFYSTKIDSELNEVSTKLSIQTSSFNNLYAKYMELINTYKPKEKPYWKSIPNQEAIDELQSKISSLRLSISDITKELVETTSKEKEHELLQTRLNELSEKIKLFESMNSHDLVNYLQETRQEISSLETSIQEMNTLYLSTLAKEQQRDFLQEKLNQYKSSIDSFSEDIKSGNIGFIKDEIESKVSLKQTYEKECMQVKLLESEKSRLESKFSSLQSSLESIQNSLKKYTIQDTDILRSLIQNTKSYQKLKDIQSKEPEQIQFPYNDEEINEIQRSLPVFISEYNQNYKIALQCKIIQEHQDITEQTEEAIQQHLAKTKKVLDFVEIMKKELEHKQRHTQNDTKRESLQNTIEILKTELKENEKQISEIPIQNLETYITMKTEIQMNIGDCLQCPDCNTNLELNGSKLCKLTKPRYSKEDGKKRIELLNKLSDVLKQIKAKESELEYLQKEKDSLPIPKPEYTSEQAVKTYNDELVSKYKSFHDAVTKFKIGVVNKFAKTALHAEDILKQIPLYQKRKSWESEFTQAKQTYSIDESLEILSVEKLREYEQAIIELPMFLSREKQYQDSLKETSESLENVKLDLLKLKSLDELSSLLEFLDSQIKILESTKSQILEYTKLSELIKSATTELEKISIQTSSEIIQESLTKLKTKSQNLKETLSGYSQFEVLTEEYRTIESKLKSIILSKSSQELSILLESTNQDIVSYEDYVQEGKQLVLMVNTRAELESTQKLMMELTNQQSYVNRLRMLIIEVTNSSLQNLVDSINACTNSILEDLFENDIKLELKLFKEDKKTNNLKPRLNFAIYYNNNTYDSIMGLSGGEKDRISLALTIALACVNPSPVLFLDETMSSINQDLRESSIEVLKKFVVNQSQKTVLLVEHNIVEGYLDSIIDL